MRTETRVNPPTGRTRVNSPTRGVPHRARLRGITPRSIGEEVGRAVCKLILVLRFVVRCAFRWRMIDQSQHCKVLPQRFNTVPDPGRLPTSGAKQGVIGAACEHTGEAIFTEGMPTLKHHGGTLVISVSGLANRARRELHCGGKKGGSSKRQGGGRQNVCAS